MKYLDLQGNEVAPGKCVVPDHTVKTFNITIRSNTGITPDTIKEWLQRRYEVLECTLTDGTVYIK